MCICLIADRTCPHRAHPACYSSCTQPRCTRVLLRNGQSRDGAGRRWVSDSATLTALYLLNARAHTHTHTHSHTHSLTHHHPAPPTAVDFSSCLGRGPSQGGDERAHRQRRPVHSALRCDCTVHQRWQSYLAVKPPPSTDAAWLCALIIITWMSMTLPQLYRGASAAFFGLLCASFNVLWQRG
jgi:hypothetical protein